MKYHIGKNTVQETLVIPLFGRLVCSERFPELFPEMKGTELVVLMQVGFIHENAKPAKWHSEKRRWEEIFM